MNSFLLKQKGLQPELLVPQQMSRVQRAFALLLVHPCYVINILKSGLMQFEDQKVLLT